MLVWPKMDVGYGGNGLATTHLDSAFKKHNTNTTILEIRAIRDGQSIQEDKRLYLASRYAKIRDQQLGDCEKQKIYNKNNMLAERTGLEPATPGVTGRYSNQLNYRSNR